LGDAQRLLQHLTEAHQLFGCPFPGEHEHLWGRLVTGWPHKVSGQTKQGCGAPSFAMVHSIPSSAGGHSDPIACCMPARPGCGGSASRHAWLCPCTSRRST
jgi:hypothetical protein